MAADADLYIDLSMDELREVARVAVADGSLPLFERNRPDLSRDASLIV
ncbi:hypothetical protein [Kineosporia sp. A_224]|nr:hypothetical protein [Kineosporia sp. A_224]